MAGLHGSDRELLDAVVEVELLQLASEVLHRLHFGPVDSRQFQRLCLGLGAREVQ